MTMKKFLSMLLVLTMVLAVAGGAMAACKFKKGDWVEFKCDANAYNAAKAAESRLPSLGCSSPRRRLARP